MLAYISLWRTVATRAFTPKSVVDIMLRCPWLRFVCHATVPEKLPRQRGARSRVDEKLWQITRSDRTANFLCSLRRQTLEIETIRAAILCFSIFRLFISFTALFRSLSVLIFHQFFRFLYHSIFPSSLLFNSFFCQYVHLSYIYPFF
jgi:hypothetical protein